MRNWPLRILHGWAGLGVALAGLVIWVDVASALSPGRVATLVPHRAIYDMQLDNSRPGSSITGVAGRMVFEFSGSPCEGYTLNTRLVTQITDRGGRATLSDLRSSTWEEGEGRKFRFNSSQYLNQELNEVTSGSALRNASDPSITVELKAPERTKLRLPGKVLFPAQHARAVLDAAVQGRSIVEATLYEGSEKGEKLYQTSAFIGRPLPPGANKALKPVENASILDGLLSWPISVSYYDREQPDKTTPAYELAYRFYSNGVSRRLLIDYGDFSVTGSLSGLEIFDIVPCK